MKSDKLLKAYNVKNYNNLLSHAFLLNKPLLNTSTEDKLKHIHNISHHINNNDTLNGSTQNLQTLYNQKISENIKIGLNNILDIININNIMPNEDTCNILKQILDAVGKDSQHLQEYQRLSNYYFSCIVTTVLPKTKTEKNNDNSYVNKIQKEQEKNTSQISK